MGPVFYEVIYIPYPGVRIVCHIPIVCCKNRVPLHWLLDSWNPFDSCPLAKFSFSIKTRPSVSPGRDAPQLWSFGPRHLEARSSVPQSGGLGICRPEG